MHSNILLDGLLLADLWDELVLPSDVRSAWAPLMTREPEQAA